MLPTKDPPQNKRPTQTESERQETNIPSKWRGKKKKAVVPILIADKIDFKMKRNRRTLHNTQGKNPPRRYKHHKNKCKQQKNTQIHKKIFG